jgi:thiamine-phosphate pyrophosphorylase
MKDKIIGISTHSLEEAKEAVASGADYIGVGPVFETVTKEDREPLVGLDLLARVKQTCQVPYVAIGGIRKANIQSVRAAGCHRAAVISDILLASDIEERCRVLKGMLL